MPRTAGLTRVTVNEPAVTRLVLDAARDVLGDYDVEEVAAPIMGAEDLS